MYRLSPSTLNLFVECKRCFYLAVKYRLKRPSIHASITTGLDTAIKRYFDLFRGTLLLPPILQGKINGTLILSLPKSLNCFIHGNEVWGKLDECIQLANGSYAPLDHKTRASSPVEIHKTHQFQMDVYTLLLEKNNYKTDRKAYLVYYFPKLDFFEGNSMQQKLKLPKDISLSHKSGVTLPLPFEVEVKELKTNPDLAEKVFIEAIDVLSGGIPSPDVNCEFCRWVDHYNNFI